MRRPRAARVTYRLELPPERADAVAARCADLMAESKVWVDRLKPGPKRLNIRPYFRDLGVRPNPPAPFPGREGGEAGAGSSLVLDLWVTQTGTARADELLKLLDLTDLAEAGAVLERTTVELRDEVRAADPTDQPPDGPADTLPLDPAAIAALSRREEEQPAAAGWGVSPAGPVVE